MPGQQGKPSAGIKASSFEEKTLGSANEKTDSRYTAHDSELAKNSATAVPKVGLKENGIDTKSVVMESAEQPIPLEYRDILK